MNLTPESVRAAIAEHGSIRKAAPHLGVDERTVRRFLAKTGGKPVADRAPRAEKPRMKRTKDEASFVTPAAPDLQLGDLDRLISERGLDPEEWDVVSATLNEWEALGSADENGESPTRTLRQMKVTLKRKVTLALLSPATHVPEVVKPARVRRATDAPKVWVVEGDHQAPYFDEGLDAAATALVADLQPDAHVFLGDLLDLPTISRHADHPAAMAAPQECIEAGYGILRRRAEAAPNARRLLLKGNHDWRLESELLARAERLYGIRPAGEDVHALSLQRLLHLDTLGVELVEDPRGWEHAEVEVVEGIGGLVIRHGWITGANTASRSMVKRGRSLLVGHTHSRETVFAWDPSAELERQAAVIGTMSLARDARFPHFAVADTWLQGLATVTVWPSGRFQVEHAVWSGGALYWRDRAWRP